MVRLQLRICNTIITFNYLQIFVSYGTAQKLLYACTQAAGSAPKGDISTGMGVPVGNLPVSSKACL